MSIIKTMNEIAPTGVLLCPDCGSYGSKVDVSLVEDKYTHSCKCGYKHVTYGYKALREDERTSRT